MKIIYTIHSCIEMIKISRSKNLRLVYILQICVLLFSGKAFSQNSMTGDGFGGRAWYVAHNYQVGSYSGYTVCNSDSQLYAWGGNLWGEMGNGTGVSTDTPIAVQNMNHVKFYSTGYISGVIKSDNVAWLWGGHALQSGLANTPQQVLGNVKFLDCGINHAVFVKNDGTVWGVGQNVFGQLGNGTNRTYSSPVTSPVQMVGINNAVRAIAVGMGLDSYSSPTGLYAASVILLNDSTLKITGGNHWFTDSLTNVPIAVPGLAKIVDIKGNSTAVFALTDSGEVYSFGRSYFGGELGYSGGASAYTPPAKINFPSGAGPIVALSANCDGFFTLALDENGNVYGWGENWDGQLGDPNLGTIQSPTLLVTNAVDIFAGETFCYVLKADYSLWCSGTSGTNDTYGSIWMNLSNQRRAHFTQIDPTIAPMNLCAPKTFGTVPVRLLNFTCTLHSNDVILNWRAEEENNLAMYQIQMSYDGIHFLEAATISAKGSNHNYDYYLKQTNNLVYYRLKMIDINGKISFSQVRTVKLKSGPTIFVSPNPAVDYIYINGIENNNNHSVLLFSSNGQRLKEIKTYKSGQPINIASLSQGVYLIKVFSDDNNVGFLKFVKF